MAGTCSNPGRSNGSGATCERNCAGEVRVKAYSRYHTNSCTWVYGDWVSGTNQSTLRLNSDSSGGTASLSCGPCQMAMAVPTAICPISGQYNSCTGACVIACTGGKVWNGSACVCPPSLPNLGSDGTCYAACMGVNSPVTSRPAFRATAIPYGNDLQNKCGSCDRYAAGPGADLGLDKPTHLCLYRYSSGTVQVQCSNEQYMACNPANILCTKAGQVQKGYCQPRRGITCTQKGNASDNEICSAWCSKDYSHCPGSNYTTVP